MLSPLGTQVYFGRLWLTQLTAPSSCSIPRALLHKELQTKPREACGCTQLSTAHLMPTGAFPTHGHTSTPCKSAWFALRCFAAQPKVSRTFRIFSLFPKEIFFCFLFIEGNLGLFNCVTRGRVVSNAPRRTQLPAFIHPLFPSLLVTPLKRESLLISPPSCFAWMPLHGSSESASSWAGPTHSSRAQELLQAGIAQPQPPHRLLAPEVRGI